MCGIVYTRRLDGKPANNVVKSRFKHQKKRGTDGFGMLAIHNGEIMGLDRTTGESDILECLNNTDVNEILFHHRFPTSTPNFKESTHPIHVQHDDFEYDYYVVHNGVISNDAELRETHNEMGFEYTTEIRKEWQTRDTTYFDISWNDTEAFAIDLALAIENDKEGLDARGSIAFVALAVDKQTNRVANLYFGRNTKNPLVLEVQDEQFMALKSLGKGETVQAHKLYKVDSETGEMSKTNFDVGLKTAYTGKRNYSGYNYNKNKTGFHQRDDTPPPPSERDFDEIDDSYYDNLFENMRGNEIESRIASGKNENMKDLFGIDVMSERYLGGIVMSCNQLKDYQHENEIPDWLSEEIDNLEADYAEIKGVLRAIETGARTYNDDDLQELKDVEKQYDLVFDSYYKLHDELTIEA